MTPGYAQRDDFKPNVSLAESSIGNRSVTLLTLDPVKDFENAVVLLNRTKRFVLPIPALRGGGAELRYPEGHEKANQEIYPKPDKIVQRGIVFKNETDNAWQGVQGNGKEAIIINDVTERQAKTISAYIRMTVADISKITPKQVQEILTYCSQELGLRDMFDKDLESISRDMEFIKPRTIPDLNSPQSFLGYMYSTKETAHHAVRVEGSFSFQGPVLQSYEDGAIAISNGRRVWFVDKEVCERGWKIKEVGCDEIPIWDVQEQIPLIQSPNITSEIRASIASGKQSVRVLMGLLDQPDVDLAKAAAATLKNKGLEVLQELMPELIDIARGNYPDHGNHQPHTRACAIEILGASKSKQAFFVIIEILENSQQDVLRRAAIEALTNFDGRLVRENNGIQLLENIVKDSKDRCRVDAIIAAGKIGSEAFQVREALRDAVKTGSVKIRCAAIEALSRTGYGPLTDIPLTSSVRDPLVKRATLNALGNVIGEIHLNELVKRVTSILGEENLEYKLLAAHILKKCLEKYNFGRRDEFGDEHYVPSQLKHIINGLLKSDSEEASYAELKTLLRAVLKKIPSDHSGGGRKFFQGR